MLKIVIEVHFCDSSSRARDFCQLSSTLVFRAKFMQLCGPRFCHMTRSVMKNYADLGVASSECFLRLYGKDTHGSWRGQSQRRRRQRRSVLGAPPEIAPAVGCLGCCMSAGSSPVNSPVSPVGAFACSAEPFFGMVPARSCQKTCECV